MENPESNSSEQVPTNRAQSWLRLVMWVLPSGFAICSLFAWWRLDPLYTLSKWRLGAYLLVNLLFIIASGWFDAVLNHRIEKSAGQMSAWVITFLLYQLFAIPTFSIVLMWTIGFIIEFFR